SDVMAEVSTPPPARSILTTVIAAPWSTDATVPGSRFRMLTPPIGSVATLTSVDLISSCTAVPAANFSSFAPSLVMAAVISGPFARRAYRGHGRPGLHRLDRRVKAVADTELHG